MPLAFSPLWHSWQRATSKGRTCFSKNSRSAADGMGAAPSVADCVVAASSAAMLKEAAATSSAVARIAGNRIPRVTLGSLRERLKRFVSFCRSRRDCDGRARSSLHSGRWPTAAYATSGDCTRRHYNLAGNANRDRETNSTISPRPVRVKKMPLAAWLSGLLDPRGAPARIGRNRDLPPAMAHLCARSRICNAPPVSLSALS